ncbi:MAG TPA: amylo-alpha-1,6-glucosidase [Beijerinckiaceae bacterium]|nr:amylo-alpha-1,6-glucosidase [Beijerinckiaceae bacterium]
MDRFEPDAEWLEADGRGGYASGTVSGIRTRRYHALLLSATTPPSGRMALVNGLEIWIETGGKTFALSSQRYPANVVYPGGASRISGFIVDPWPIWTFSLPDGSVTQEVLVVRDSCETILWWRISGPGVGRLRVRPLISGRGYHDLHHENAVFNFAAKTAGQTVCFNPYPGVPPIAFSTNGSYRADPLWWRNFLYEKEAERGLDCEEDLASPGEFVFDLSADQDAVMILRAQPEPIVDAFSHGLAGALAERARRSARGSRLARSAEHYRVRRGAGGTLMAGYPWFLDWGRDTFVAMRGLAIALGDLEAAEAILTAWAPFVSAGMLPNRFPDEGAAPQYNSVDAALWYVVAAHDWFAACEQAKSADRPAFALVQKACEAILSGYERGARYSIGADADGLLKAGEAGMQLTWMDAKVGDRVVTPRIGKPVEVQALWINALKASARWSDRWRRLEERASESFAARFPNPAGGLYDVIDADHVPGRVDASLRPNQILAAGGLPFVVADGELARKIVDCVERSLLTPLGLRTLAPDDPAYVGRYRGGPAQRDGAYHQGTAWPWLMGPFVDAWLRVRDRSPQALEEARVRFLEPLRLHLDQAGIGHVCEVVDGDAPHTPGGCPFQAWSLGELIRIEQMVKSVPQNDSR